MKDANVCLWYVYLKNSSKDTDLNAKLKAYITCDFINPSFLALPHLLPLTHENQASFIYQVL